MPDSFKTDSFVPDSFVADKQQQQPKTVNGFLSNAVSSAGRFAGDIAGAVIHPERTVEGVTGLLEGMAEKSGFKPVAGQSHQQNVDALMKMYGDRYGSIEKFKSALYTDPVGVMADIATLASGFGAVGKGAELAADAAKLTRVADMAGAVAKGADVVSSVTDPLRLAGRAADATGVTGLVQRGAEAAKVGLAKSALRGGYNVNADAEDINAAAQTMARQNLPLSETGSQQITKSLADLQAEKLKLAGAAARRGVTIDPQQVQLRVDDVRRKYGLQVNPDADLKQVDKVADTFSRNNPNPIPIDQAELLKEGTYQTNKYGKNVPPQLAATAAAEQAAARGLKEEIEKALPEVGAINSKQAELLNLEPILQRALNKYINGGGFTGNLKRQMFSKTGLEIGGSAGLLTHNAEYGVAAAAMNAVLSDPMVKSRLMMAVNWAQKANPSKYGAPNMATALSRVNEYAAQFQPQQ